MKKGFLTLIFILSQIVFGQFKISGEFQNYNNLPVIVKIYDGASLKVINRVVTDANGKMTVNIPENYSGIIHLGSAGSAYLELLTDNENVELFTVYNGEDFVATKFSKGKTAIGYQDYQTYENLADIKNNIFPILKGAYTEDDAFYKAMQKEENRIEQLNPSADLPLLKYYDELSGIVNMDVDNPALAQSQKEVILNRLVNDNERIEKTGFMAGLVMGYLRNSLFGLDQNEFTSGLESSIDTLLEETDLETPRGQNVLTAIFQVLPQGQFKNVIEKYYDKANSLTCDLTDELQGNLFAHNMAPGNKVPNIVFQKPVKGNKTLYDVKADKKIIVFWASWCPACQNEMPFIQEYYKNFKKEGGEIVSVSLDFNEDDFNEHTKDFEWVNYTELLKWDTQGVKEFGVQSTPTLFLVDKDNKLIKKGTHISDLVEL